MTANFIAINIFNNEVAISYDINLNVPTFYFFNSMPIFIWGELKYLFICVI